MESARLCSDVVRWKRVTPEMLRVSHGICPDEATGFLVGQEIDEDGDGEVDTQVSYDYSCWD